MSGFVVGRRARALFAPPNRPQRPFPRWLWLPFAVTAVVLAALAVLRALGVPGPPGYLWLTEPVQPVVPAVFLLALIGATTCFGRAHPLPGRVVGVLTVSAFAVGALVLGLAAYINCAPQEPPFFGPLIWVMSGSGAEPWGAGPGCPDAPPLAHHLARLCAAWVALTSIFGVVVAVLRRQIDRLLATWAGRAIVVLGASPQAGRLIKALAAGRAPGTALLVVDASGDEAFIAALRGLGARVVSAEAVDDGVLWSLLTRRGRIAVEAVHIVEQQPPEALTLFVRVAGVLRRARPNPALVSRVLVRVDDPWAAEVWRRSHFGPEHTWLTDALSATEQTAGLVVDRVEASASQRLVLAGASDLASGVLAEVAQRARERRVLGLEEPAPPRVVLVGPQAGRLAQDHAAAERRFGNDPGFGAPEIVAEPLSDETLRAALSAGPGSMLVLADADAVLGAPTRLAAQLPAVPVLAMDPRSTEFPEQSLMGRLTVFGVSLLAGDQAPEDHWSRIARLLHTAHLAGSRADGVRRPSAAPWPELPVFYRNSNLRQLAALLSGVGLLGRSWLTGPDAGTELTEPELAWLSEREHESWRRFYEANGWRHADRRDDARLRHDWLVAWAALPAQARDRTIAGVSSALSLLATAGYRSRLVEEWASFGRTGQVRAERLERAWRWRTESGADMRAVAGDWRVTDPATGRAWSVADALFSSTHEPLGGGRFRRVGTVRARPARLAERVDTLEGTATAVPGEWLVEGSAGERWLVPGEHFLAGYDRV